MTRKQKIMVKKGIRKLVIVFLMILAFCSGFFGRTLLNAHAEEGSAAQKNRYYTSILLENGDTLWKVARQYAEQSGCSTREYVRELIRMNGLKSEEIHSGEFLTVFYYGE